MLRDDVHLLVCAVLLGGGGAVITGTVAYRERVALPPDAVAELSLIDATIQDVAAKVIAQTTVKSRRYEIEWNELSIYGSERRPLHFTRATP